MKKIYPNKLKKGDEIRVIAPSRSLSMISQETRNIADERFKEVGLKLTFGKNVMERDDFDSSSIDSRVNDLYDAFSDKNVKAVISVIGGFNCNQLLRYIDWNLIKNNPKILCGYSDITVLSNAIFNKTGLVTYSGPHYSSFGQKLYFDYTLKYFKKCFLENESFKVFPSEEWSDDCWYKNQEDRFLIKNTGFFVINEGLAEGTSVGGNICTLNLLQGTEYMPSLENSVLFIEDDDESLAYNFDRDLQSLIHLPSFSGVRGVIIGRFQKKSEITNNLLTQIIKSKKELNEIPIISGVDFGHTDPMISFPIGGDIKLTAKKDNVCLEILKINSAF